MKTNLGKSILHWLCICGQPNQDSRKACLSCDREQPEGAEYTSSHGNSKVVER